MSDQPQTRSARLRVNFPDGPQEYTLPATPDEPYIIGRGKDAALRFESNDTYAYISNRHCHIVYDNRVYRIADGAPSGKASSAGTLINGRKLESGYHTLQNGDVIKLGELNRALTVTFIAPQIEDTPTRLDEFMPSRPTAVEQPSEPQAESDRIAQSPEPDPAEQDEVFSGSPSQSSRAADVPSDPPSTSDPTAQGGAEQPEVSSGAPAEPQIFGDEPAYPAYPYPQGTFALQDVPSFGPGRVLAAIVLSFIGWWMAFSAYFLYQLESSAADTDALRLLITAMYVLGTFVTGLALTWTQPRSNRITVFLWTLLAGLIATSGMFLVDDPYRFNTLTFIVPGMAAEEVTVWGFRLGYGLLAAFMLSRFNVITRPVPGERRFNLPLIVITVSVWVFLSFLAAEVGPELADLLVRPDVAGATDLRLNEVIRAGSYAFLYGGGIALIFGLLLAFLGDVTSER